MSLKLITGPASEPITLQEAKLHLRVIADVADVTANPEDAYITALIVAARQGAEQITGRALMPQTWEIAFDDFERCFDGNLQRGMKLAKPPIAAITSVKYLDSAGVLQTLATTDYELNSYREPAEIIRPYLTAWPITQRHDNAVLIRFTCGYTNAAAVPQEIKQWMLLRIGAMYENREEIVVNTRVASVELSFVDRLLDAYKVWSN